MVVVVVLRALEEEADALDLNLEQLEAEKKGLEEKAAAERAEAASVIKSLEEHMQQQQEAQERELEEQQAEKRCVAVCNVLWADLPTDIDRNIFYVGVVGCPFVFCVRAVVFFSLTSSTHTVPLQVCFIVFDASGENRLFVQSVFCLVPFGVCLRAYFGTIHPAIPCHAMVYNNNRSVVEDLEDVTERLRSANEAHGKEVDEHQRRSNDLQERLVETRALKGQVSEHEDSNAVGEGFLDLTFEVVLVCWCVARAPVD